MTNENLFVYAYLGCITRKLTLQKSIYQQFQIFLVDFFGSILGKRWFLDAKFLLSQQ